MILVTVGLEIQPSGAQSLEAEEHKAIICFEGIL